MARKIDGWLARLSDPAGLNARAVATPFTIGEAELLCDLLEEAGRHNVRVALVRNLNALWRSDPGSLMTGNAADVKRVVEPHLARANELRLLDVARATLLARIGREIQDDMARAGLPAVIVKGVDFAEAAYGGIQNRAFTDVDLLVRPGAESDVGTILSRAGFIAHEPPDKRAAYSERKWTRTDTHGAEILVEIQTDLVHAPDLRRHMSLTYDLYAAPDLGGVTAAARLVLAALHGATSHGFKSLQHVVDGLMIARMGVEQGELRERAARSGAALPVVTMLRLATALYDCPQCQALIDALLPVSGAWLDRYLITAPLVLSAQDLSRSRLFPQRKLYRLLLKGSSVPNHNKWSYVTKTPQSSSK